MSQTEVTAKLTVGILRKAKCSALINRILQQSINSFNSTNTNEKVCA